MIRFRVVMGLAPKVGRVSLISRGRQTRHTGLLSTMRTQRSSASWEAGPQQTLNWPGTDDDDPWSPNISGNDFLSLSCLHGPVWPRN